MKRFWLVVLVLLCASGILLADNPPLVINLPQAIDLALKQGDDWRIYMGNLAAAQAVRNQAYAKAALSLSATGSYAMNDTLGDFTLRQKALGISSVSVAGSTSSDKAASDKAVAATHDLVDSAIFPQTINAGLTLGNPETKIGLTGSEIIFPLYWGLYTNTSTVGVTISQTIWNGYVGGASKATIDKAEITLKGQQVTSDSGKLSTIYKVKQAYYTLLAAQKNLSVLQTIAARSNDYYHQLQAKFEVSQASRYDLDDARIAAMSADTDLLNGQNVIQTARIKLAAILKVDLSLGFIVDDATEAAPEVSDMNAAVITGLAKRNDLKQFELNRQSSQIDRTLIQGQQLPTISVNGGTSLTINQLNNTNAVNFNIGASLSTPILDAGLAGQQLAEIDRRLEVNDTQKAQLTASITSDIQSAWTNLDILRKRLDIAKQSYEHLNLKYQIVQTQVEAGSANGQDLLTAAVNLANQKYAMEKAGIDTQLGVALLLNAMGM